MPQLPDSAATWIYELYEASLLHLVNRIEQQQTQQDCDIRTAWSFFLSDFLVTCDEQRDAALRAKTIATEHNINIFVVGCGRECDEAIMHELAQPGRPPLMMRSVKDWRLFFEFLGKSLRSKSRTVPGRPLELEAYEGSRLIADS